MPTSAAPTAHAGPAAPPVVRASRGSRASRALGAMSATLVAVPAGAVAGATPAHAIVIPAPPTKNLPAELDVAPPYQRGVLCLPDPKPGPLAFARLLNEHYGARAYGVVRPCAAEHGEGRALDWMINANNPDQLALANSITRWLSATDEQGRPGAMARRFGINYIIWNRQIWRAYRPAAGWAPYTGASPHTDHIHITFTWDGAYQRTSWWTGKALTTILSGPLPGATTPVTVAPTPVATATGYPLLRQGAVGPDVVLAQRVIGTSPDGEFGPATAAALGSWQGRNGVPVTSVLDNATWARMIALKLVPARTVTTTPSVTPPTTTPTATPPTSTSLTAYANTTLSIGSRGAAVTALQRALGGVSVDGEFGPMTKARVEAYQRSKGLAVTGTVTTPVWNALMGKAPTTPTVTTPPKTTTSPLTAYSSLTLSLGSRGAAVQAAQRALGGVTVDGEFGPLTRARVEAYQRSKGLPVNGIINAPVWSALMGRPVAVTPTPPTPTKPAPVPPGVTTANLTTEFTALKGQVLREGARGNAVKALQAALGGLVVDGVFGSRTTSAVKALQTSHGLQPTGVVERTTWNRVEMRKYPLIGYWNTVVKRGSTGPAVVALQKALRVPADGQFGPQTEAAVKAAQARAKLTQTGIVTTVTWRAIDNGR